MLMAAEYIMSGGNYQVILCERASGFELTPAHLSAVPLIVVTISGHRRSQLHQELVRYEPCGVFGADGLMIEVHPVPPRSPTGPSP